MEESEAGSVSQLSELAQRSVFAGNKRRLQLRLQLKTTGLRATFRNTLPRLCVKPNEMSLLVQRRLRQRCKNNSVDEAPRPEAGLLASDTVITSY